MAATINTPDPLRSATASAIIGGRPIHVACASFADRNFVAITQYKKLGTVINVTINQGQPGTKPGFHTSVLMGKDSHEYHVFARAIAELVSGISRPNDDVTVGPTSKGKPLLCTLAVAEATPAVLAVACSLVKDCDVWSPV